ncbi:2-succinyl-5-enolpyruvyl-6-hydroxy-3-cyclohexene-1-carboxylic-acid synthase [Thermostichus vulcanus]|uniref:2-succinyl-5-enolpyruvyl-6-hydroxy-3-cyclohexene-1-carboxylate synthase n=1 Tax=Thermostichus vulcanus str. 'Rupite' TaxID=2813851 RepID=A0ABT0C688_THEVL|nr:2-succinyl-5-enolpyruvyl-6-hydroxy-3-cyclohexene-1-carboxylic-acid synthase [Thermostichus vulcanus str. 'Rupite']
MKALDWRNTNALWGSLLAETLSRLGCRLAVVCPGSRSAPITCALAQHPDIEAIPVLDERSAAFFALGLAQQHRQPIPLVCTSGSAAAHFFPALLEAAESGIPMLILTADRPPELRHCRSGQTLDQLKLYGHYPNWQAELALPAADLGQLSYLRQTLIHAWERTLYPFPGPVHLNVPFRDPLAPVADGSTEALASLLDEPGFEETFFQGVTPWSTPPRNWINLNQQPFWQEWQRCERGVILAGPAQPQDPHAYAEAVARLAMTLAWPVLAEGLSPLRNYAHLNPYLITTYDLLLRRERPPLWPEQVIQLGSLPTSKELRQTLAALRPRTWRLDPRPENGDPLHNPTTHIPLAVEDLAMGIPGGEARAPSHFLQTWLRAEAQVRAALDETLANLPGWFEGKVAWWLAQHLPAHTPLFIANSTPVRDVEWFWPPNARCIQPYFNRGANGIDGLLSTAFGVAHRHRPTVLLTGDLAFLHDSNGLQLSRHLQGSLTVVLINNRGGGIFEFLPIAEVGRQGVDPPFEPYFATPQATDFALLCQAHGIDHCFVQGWEHLAQCLDPLPGQGVRILEILTDRRADADYRRQLFRCLADLPSNP